MAESADRRPQRSRRRRRAPGSSQRETDAPPYQVILGLQRSAGNSAVSALLSGSLPVQRSVAPAAELTLAEFVGDADLANALHNSPVIKRQFPSEKSPAIYKIQGALKKLGFAMPKSTLPGGEPDGIFGEETEATVQAFQTSHGLAPDGRVGHDTLEKMQVLLKPSGPTPIVSGKRGGVDSFTVKWLRDPFPGMSDAVRGHDGRIRLEYAVTFKDDLTHDPKMAEFRQAIHEKVTINGTLTHDANVADDGYGHRAGGFTRSETYTATGYTGDDKPGVIPIAHTDDVLIEFTVTDEVIDTSVSSNPVIARRGPHTATIRGRHTDPGGRKYEGVPFDS